MKNIRTAISAVALLAFFSCSDFLTKNDPTKQNSGNFYKTEKHFEQAVNGVYSQLQGYVGGAWQYLEYITDNTTLHYNPLDRGQGPGLEAIEYWSYNSTTMEQIGPYNLYSGIYSYLVNINTILAKLKESTINEKVKANFEGQVRFMRALYYFDLVRLFGDVILVTEPITNPDKAWDYERSPVDEVYKQIDEDLKLAVELLPVKSDVPKEKVGQLTKAAAMVMQGRTYMTRKQFGAAATVFKQVLSMGYSLMPDYASVFDPKQKNNAESIFEVQFQGGNELGEYSGFLYNFYPRESFGAVIPFPNANGGGWNTPTLDIIGDYEPGDKRKEVSLKEGFMSKEQVWVPVPYINKYNHPHTIQGRPDDNWPMMRYAEVLLTLAEAINEQSGPTNEAYGYLNDVRIRAGLAAVSGLSKEEFRKTVLHERRIELAFENHRWFDLKRTMTPDELVKFLTDYAKREMANPTTPTRAATPFTPDDYVLTKEKLLFPIPAREIRLNPNLKQNPGYK